MSTLMTARQPIAALLAATAAQLFSGANAALYVLVSTPFIADILGVRSTDVRVPLYSAWVQAAFLVGWAVGGTLFGSVSDRFGRSRALGLSVLVYAMFTGLCAIEHVWWHVLIFRFLVGAGVGGQGSAGVALISETWPSSAHPWLGALQQAAGTGGNLMAVLAFGLLPDQPRPLFLIGLVPAALALWVLLCVSESEQWIKERKYKGGAASAMPSISMLFIGSTARTTFFASAICLLALVVVQSSIFWLPQYLRSLPDLVGASVAERGHYVSHVLTLTALAGMCGSFAAAALAHRFGNRLAIVMMFAGGLTCMIVTYGFVHRLNVLLVLLPLTQAFIQGVFGIFLAYLPSVFPVLLRSAGSGFSLNIGRVVAAVSVVLAGMGALSTNFRVILFGVGLLYIPAMLVTILMPKLLEEKV